MFDGEGDELLRGMITPPPPRPGRRPQLDGDLDEIRAVRERNRGGQLPTYLSATTRADVEPHRLGEMNQVCRFCYARHFSSETTGRNVYTKCCLNGRVRLPPLQQVPQFIRNLFDAHDRGSRNFRKHVLKYNYAFQFVSSEANLRNIPGRGPYVYSIQGKIHHHISNVNVNADRARLGPVYFLHPEQALQQRLDNDN